PFDDEPGDPALGDVSALEENADGAFEPVGVARADDVVAREEEFEVWDWASWEGRVGGGGGAGAEVEGAVEFGEDVGGVVGCEGALGGAFAVYAYVFGLAADMVAVVGGRGDGGGGDGEEDGEDVEN
ncbi:MAG: hypothetical protein Q9223_005342, partial [Gallowayella weberi]